MAFKDYYKILGINRSANEEEIKRAFHRLAHQYHPDKNKGDGEKFKEINEAYQVLSSKEKRTQYDRFGQVFEGAQFGDKPFGFDFSARGGPASGWEFGFDPSNFGDAQDISEIFDAFFEGAGLRRKRRIYERGADLETLVELTLEEAFRGVFKNLNFSRFLACQKCAGLGYFSKEGVIPCIACNGRGEIRESRRGFFGSFTKVVACEKCLGTGQRPNHPCSDCQSSGRLKAKVEVKVEISPGVENGQIIKIVNGGDAGARGGAKGDLYVQIKIKPHSLFERRGPDLYLQKEISLLDVLLDKKIAAQTIGGNILSFHLPNNVNLVDQIRIPGEGMPRFNASGRGDLYVKLVIKQPKKLSAKTKKLLEELGKEL